MSTRCPRASSSASATGSSQGKGQVSKLAGSIELDEADLTKSRVNIVTKALTLRATFAGKAKDPRVFEQAAFVAKGRVDREAYGLEWYQVLETGGVAIGPKADLEIDLEALKR